MIEIIDNFLDSEDYLKIDKILNSSEFPWYFQPTITNDSEEKTTGQFTHILYQENVGATSEWYNTFLVPIVNKLFGKMKSRSVILLSAKMNLNPMRESNTRIGSYHTDWKIPGKNFKTAIYYCNTNNGYTKITNQKIDCVSNRLIIFDGNEKHVGYACTDEQTRMIININYLLLPETYD